MSPTARRRRAAPPPDPFPEAGLAQLGIARGDHVRFRRADTERWKQATVAKRERDGSVGLHDPKGASRAIPIACIEVRGTGPRGGVVWEPLVERAARTEQMALVSPPRAATRRRPAAAAISDEVDATEAIVEVDATDEVDASAGAPADDTREDGTAPAAPDDDPGDDRGDDGPGELGQLALL